METKWYFLAAILAVCVFLLIIGFLKSRYDLVVNFILRICLGLLGIYLLNTILASSHITLGVGVNSLNALVVGLLGMPGFLLLYGTAAYFYFT
ncbi:SigmaK-factor processing regulatory protein BofA [Anaerocolumna jejuensis DSM 15929]|uniref:SigmaK-factor processing regulatory protein BofA n=1 Tax=Anaerocolumna jejuensis DSM 15929 TaxID=1121322 RepID=A0A1M6XU59_9FIRM|nr:pro-sigmaK processing inhibitor BofA family protein [Anaerocolumna jejuensis]SHL09540.1 SigmaK-factor processing regulatory protein BofA [Anaerocolumna jejuensis DSM 15929]